MEEQSVYRKTVGQPANYLLQWYVSKATGIHFVDWSPSFSFTKWSFRKYRFKATCLREARKNQIVERTKSCILRLKKITGLS